MSILYEASGRSAAAEAVDIGVEDVASQALEIIASRSSARSALDQDALAILEEAVLANDPARRNGAVEALQARKISSAKIVDLYIPEVARRLGVMWETDEATFADVTIRTNRLEGMLRDAAVDWLHDSIDNPFAPTILIVVPERQQHTLGAMVLATQFRRCGAQTTLSLCRPNSEIVQEWPSSGYDMVAISTSENQDVDSLREFIAMLRAIKGKKPVVAVGGGMLGVHQDLARTLDADMTTNNPVKALQACGLKNLEHGWGWANGRTSGGRAG